MTTPQNNLDKTIINLAFEYNNSMAPGSAQDTPKCGGTK
jgi:hypothetical protein